VRLQRLARAGVSFGVLLVLAGCSDDDGVSAPTTARVTETAVTGVPSTPAPTNPSPSLLAPVTSATTATTAVVSTTATTAPPDAAGMDPGAVVAVLASDEFAGRDEGTDGWRMAQEYLAGRLAAIAEPAFAGRPGAAGYVADGRSANIVGIIRGSEEPDEYVVVGAHYDGLGDAAASGGCRVLDPADTICNGAADNAAGVAVVLATAAEVARTGPPRRSLLIAFWDREEDGLLGSADFLAEPVVPVDRIVASLNLDIQGANLLPSLSETTIMVGAETGGAPLVEAARAATAASTLRTYALSLVFGQGRSDHANFVGAGVPSVFFTDATNGCYHTTRDDLTMLDLAKLDQQLATAVALTTRLLGTDELPVFVPDAPIATYADAVAMLELTTTGSADVALLEPAERETYETYVAELQRVVADGEAAFDDADVGPLLGGAAALVEMLADLECDR
jgi:hypothetical protein